MPTFKITGPDGKSYKVTGANAEGALAALKGHIAAPQDPNEPPQATLDELSKLSTDPELSRQNIEKANPTSKVESAIRGIGQGLTFGFGDEIGGALQRLGLQKEGTQDIRAGNETAQKANPITYGAGELGGAIGGAVAAPAIAPFRGAGVAARVGNAATEGAALSGAYGAGTATEGNRVAGALQGGAIGGLTGGALGGVAGAIAGRGAARAAADVVPTTAEIKAASSAGYKTAEDAGLTVSPKSFGKFADDVGGTLQKEGFDADLHPSAKAVGMKIWKAVQEGNPPNLQNLQNLRTLASNAVTDSIMRPSDRRLASAIRDHLDDYLDTIKPGDVVGGNPEVAIPALKQARADWGKFRRSERIDEAMNAAKVRASQFSGSGLENAIRTEFRGLIRNQKKMSAFSPEERTAIHAIANGTPINNLMRTLGKFAPTGVVPAVLAGGAGFGAGGPLGAAAAMAGGGIARAIATRGTKNAVNRASQLVRSRGANVLEPDPETIRTLLQIAAMTGRTGGLAANVGVSGVQDSLQAPPTPQFQPGRPPQ